LKRARSTAALVPSPAIHRRLFLVGCPGAGTALVRDLLASQPGLHRFPRTHLFLRSFGMRGRRLPWAWMGITLGKERRILEQLAERSTGSEQAPALPPRSLLLRRSLDGLLATFDRLALAAGCRSWLDTTPRHLLHARLIERMVPRARIVHVVRDGRDVVAAQCSGGRRHKPRAVVAEWNRALTCHAHCLQRPGHVFVLCEDLLADPVGETSRLLHHCGLQADPDALIAAVTRVMGNGADVAAAGRRRNDLRLQFREHFPVQRRRRIEHALHLDRYGEFAERLRLCQAGRTGNEFVAAGRDFDASQRTGGESRGENAWPGPLKSGLPETPSP